jgi:hypothetical protein
VSEDRAQLIVDDLVERSRQRAAGILPRPDRDQIRGGGWGKRFVVSRDVPEVVQRCQIGQTTTVPWIGSPQVQGDDDSTEILSDRLLGGVTLIQRQLRHELVLDNLLKAGGCRRHDDLRALRIQVPAESPEMSRCQQNIGAQILVNQFGVGGEGGVASGALTIDLDQPRPTVRLPDHQRAGGHRSLSMQPSNHDLSIKLRPSFPSHPISLGLSVGVPTPTM